MSQYVDLHSHILPGLDDGPTDLAGCIELVQRLSALGFSEVHGTPHQRAGLFLPSEAEMRASLSAAQREVGQVLPAMKLGLAAENYWDEVLATRLRDGSMPCYQGGLAFLFELNPAVMPPGLESTLFQASLAGRLPVLAHPERYATIQRDLANAAALGRHAALLVDLTALGGARGRTEAKIARRLVEDGLAHAAASDIHEPADAKDVAQGIIWLEKHVGPTELKRLLEDNPRRILEGQLP